MYHILLCRCIDRRLDKQIGQVLVSDMRLRTSVYNTNSQGHCKCERTTVPCRQLCHMLGRHRDTSTMFVTVS